MISRGLKITLMALAVVAGVGTFAGFRLVNAQLRSRVDTLRQRQTESTRLREDNRQVLKHNGTVVYLRASLDDLWQRTRHDRNRPLLRTPDPRAKLEELFAQRDPLYREIAAVVMDTGNQSLGNLASRLEQRLRERPPAPAAGASSQGAAR